MGRLNLLALAAMLSASADWAMAATCGSIDRSGCAAQGAVASAPTKDCGADGCNLAVCCEWPSIPSSVLDPVLLNAACGSGICLVAPELTVPAVNPPVVLSAAFALLPLPGITDKCFAAQAAMREIKKKINNDAVTNILTGAAKIFVPGGLDAAIAACLGDCTAMFAAGYTGGVGVLKGFAAADGIKPVPVDDVLAAQISCLYSNDAVGKARIYWGARTLDGSSAQTFGTDIFMPASVGTSYQDAVAKGTLGTLYHELEHVQQYLKSTVQSLPTFGAEYGFEYCSNVFQKLQDARPGGEAYENNKFEVAARAKETEVKSAIAAQKCGTGATPGTINTINNNINKIINTVIPAAVATIKGYIDSAVTQFLNKINDVLTALENARTAILSAISDALTKTLAAVADALAKNLAAIADALAKILASVADALSRILAAIADALAKILAAIDAAVKAIIDFIKKKFSRVPPLPGYGCDGNDNDNNGEVDDCGEDPFAPIIHAEATALAAADRWFNDKDKLIDFVKATVKVDDDCRIVTVDEPSLSGQCDKASVTIFAKDRCNNPATKSLAVRVDDEAPKVRVVLTKAKDLSDPKSRKKLVDVGLRALTKTVSDNCDRHLRVKISVYSDEQDLKSNCADKPQALLTREHKNDRFTGWRLHLLSESAHTCGVDFMCFKADGRVYTVRVCAEDAAGNETCDEARAGVSDKQSAVSQGKLYLVAEDSGVLRKA